MKSSATNTRLAAGRLRSIEGRHNPLVKQIRKAFAEGELTGSGSCAVEGARIVEEAIRSGLRLEAVIFSQSAEEKAGRLLPQIGAHVETVILPDRLFTATVPSESPQGVAALVRAKQFSLDDILARAKTAPLLVIAGLQDPGNLGTVLRSAEAFGAGGVILAEGTVSPFNSKVIRASAGSVFRLPLARVRLAESVSRLRDNEVRLVATSSHKGAPLPQASLSPPLAVFIGNEGAGLPKTLLAEMDELVAIPHSPQVESLNAGVAASIVLYELSREKDHDRDTGAQRKALR